MKKLLNLIILILALLLVAIIWYPQWKANKPVVVRIGCDSTVTSTIFIVTNQKLFFQNERVIPEFIYYADPQAMLTDLLNEKIECAVSPWGALLKMVDVDQDSSFKVLASGDFRTSIPVDAIVTLPSNKTKIKILGDLRKKRLGYPFQLKELVPVVLKSLNLTPNDITLVDMSNNSLINALQQNKIDAAWILEPERTLALSQGISLIEEPILPKYIVAPFPGVAFVIKRTLIKKQPRIATKIKVLLDATVAFADANVEESRAMFIDYYKLDKDIYSNVYLPQFQKLVEINKGGVMSLTARMYDAGILTKTFDTQILFPEAVLFRQ
jgi:ABC-type nitrate/sulfonate/bicarbonate transport system substrate-binding protein